MKRPKKRPFSNSLSDIGFPSFPGQVIQLQVDLWLLMTLDGLLVSFWPFALCSRGHSVKPFSQSGELGEGRERYSDQTSAEQKALERGAEAAEAAIGEYRLLTQPLSSGRARREFNCANVSFFSVAKERGKKMERKRKLLWSCGKFSQLALCFSTRN